ncbi:MAG TPA: M20/M25/M40 family metallo-hydrolase [Acidimicrobiia bacterium]
MIPPDEVVELLVELIRNECVNDGTPDSGHEHRSVTTLAAYLGRDGTIVEPHPGRQSVVYRVAGTVPGAPSLILLPHLDVVPAKPDGWTHPPFDGIREAGYVWGRGAVDMLNVTSAMAAVFKRHLNGDVAPLPGDLVFGATADEEAGGRLGAETLVSDHWDLVAGEYLLTEVAGPSFRAGGEHVLPVTVAEKGPSWRRLTSRGLPGHGSQPYGRKNALVPMATAMARLGTTPTPVEITEEWSAFVTGLALERDLEERLLDPDRIDDAIDELAGDDMAFARWVHACTHLTVTPTVLHSGIKSNVVPDLAAADVDVRKLPGQDEEDVDDHFRKVMGPGLSDEIEIERIQTFPANGSPTGGPLWEAIVDSADALTGSPALVPAITPVATDARFFRARGVVAYGVGLFDDDVTFGDMLSMFHGDDERVSERSVDLTTQMLERVVARFGELTA